MRAILAASMMLAMSAMPAMASGDAGCRIDDGNLTLAARGVVGGGDVVSISQFHGELEVRAKGAPKALHKVTLEDKDLAHGWVGFDSINLHLRLKRDGVVAELVIETRHSGKENYRGSYKMYVGNLTLRGSARCSAG
jgi:hypothetical protein